MMAIKHKGNFITGDKLFRIFADESNAQGASIMIDAPEFKVNMISMGDSFVSEKMRTAGDFGGERSGAWIFRRSCLCPDGVFVAAFLTAITVGKKLSDLVNALPEYSILRKSVSRRTRDLNLLESALTNIFDPRSVLNIDQVVRLIHELSEHRTFSRYNTHSDNG